MKISSRPLSLSIDKSSFLFGQVTYLSIYFYPDHASELREEDLNSNKSERFIGFSIAEAMVNPKN